MREKIASYVDKLIFLFKEGRITELKVLHNELVENAIMENDEVLAQLGVFAYVLYKIYTQPHLFRESFWKENKRQIIDFLVHLKHLIKEGRIEEAKELLLTQEILDRVKGDLKNYIRNITKKGRTKGAARAYSYGLSLSSATSLFFAEKDLVMDYLSNSREHNITTGNLKKRIEYILSFLEGKK